MIKIKEKNYQNLVLTSRITERFASTIGKVFRWMDEARREGLLSLEDQCEVEENEFLAAHLQDIVDGTDPSIVRGKMLVYTRADSLSGIDLIVRAMEMQGLLLLQEGVNPHVMCRTLLAYVPGQARRWVEAKLPSLIISGERSVLEQIHATANRMASPEVTRTIDLYRTLNRTERFCLLLHTDRQVLARVLYGAPKYFQRFVLWSIPTRRHWLILYELQNLTEKLTSDTLAAAHAIFREAIMRRKCQ